MKSILALATLILSLFIMPAPALADPADISAAARGVVRVVIVASDGENVIPISHGSGFAVTPNRIVTNAHVVQEAMMDDTLRIGIVPSDGGSASFARPVQVSPRNDLALLELVGDLRLSPLSIASSLERDSGEVSAVGYPMNVDRAQGLDMADIFKPQPPVKSRGFLSGARPSRQFDTILHTASIARGNSGGPLLDSCGRVLGVNSFGADSNGGDAEFFFAVSNRELLPFLRANGVRPRTNNAPCRSIADIEADEQRRMSAEAENAREELAAQAQADREKRARAQMVAAQEVQSERENAMALAGLLLVLGAAAAFYAWQNWYGYNEDEELTEDEGNVSAVIAPAAKIAAVIAAAAIIAALALWFTRPGLDAVDRKVAAAMRKNSATPTENGSAKKETLGTLTCVLEPERSRIVGAPDNEVTFEWRDDGCVNSRTQYGLVDTAWSRIFVPNEEDAVSVNRYDPATQTFRTDRYLLSRSQMAAAREARASYSAPACNAEEAAANLGDLQSGVTALLPDQPNERLVYSCEVGER